MKNKKNHLLQPKEEFSKHKKLTLRKKYDNMTKYKKNKACLCGAAGSAPPW
ncbi:MAG: hypothetical protein J6K39_00255 [Clostridia bacterium]|nr:hypothetical protein [Clostridia bacterium]